MTVTTAAQAQATTCAREMEMEVQPCSQTSSEGSARKQDSSRAGGFQDLSAPDCEVIVIVHGPSVAHGIRAQDAVGFNTPPYMQYIRLSLIHI